MESKSVEVPPEVRSTRSRSKTPGLNLRVSVERDLNGTEPAKSEKVQKAPSVTTIQEELNSSQKSTAASGGGSRSVRKTRTVTSDYSSDGVSPERPTAVTKEASASATTEKSVTVTKTAVTTTSTAASSLSSSSPSKKETHQNEINRTLENSQKVILRTSTPKVTSKVSKKNTLTPEELKHHVAYKEYKEAGEYWNKYPKTDFTYSELSPFRREIAPGMVAMPNMSRPGLNKHAERINVMIQRNPNQESYIRQRYSTSMYSSSGVAGGNFALADPYDSGEETVDLSQLSRASYSSRSKRSAAQVQVEEHHTFVIRFLLSIVNLFYSVSHSVSRVFNQSEHNLYYTRIEDERGFFGKIYSFFNTLVTSIFKRIYLFISSVLFLDSWLLQTASNDIQQGRRKRKFLLLLLILLPFLLCGAFLLADEKQTIVLPASKRATIALASLSNMLPSLNDQDLDSFRKSLFQKLDFRESSFSWRSLLPSFSIGFGGGGSSTGSQYEHLKSGLQKTLSKQEYDDLMRHIDTYIEGLLAQKYLKKEQEEASAKQVISPEMTVHVASVVRENLQAYNYQLNRADVDLIAEKVRHELLASYPNVFNAKGDSSGNKVEAMGISKESIVEIQKLIKQQISITNNNLIISDHQLEDILKKILSSSQLVDLIDARVLLQMKESKNQQESHAALVDNLKNEINEIKMHFTEKLAASSLMIEDNINLLKQDHSRLAEQVSSYRLENDEKYVNLMSDIDARLAAVKQEQFTGLNKIIKKNIVTILGMNVKEDFSDADLKAWISNLFVAKDYLESRLKEHQEGVSALIQQEMERSAATLMKEISEKIQKEVLVAIQSRDSDVNIDAGTGRTLSEGDPNGDERGGGLTESDVRRIVRDALRIYDADKTGLVDYALESAGGQILSTRCTENYQTQSAQISIFGIPLWYPTNTPRTVISPTMQPGQCWAFSGFPGYLVIQLNSDIVVTGFSLEHISKLLAPNGQIDSAPKNFSVWGLASENDQEPVRLGNYQYLDNGAALQYFPVEDPTRPELVGRTFRIVELRIETNHGNDLYTCLYRFRVHGDRA